MGPGWDGVGTGWGWDGAGVGWGGGEGQHPGCGMQEETRPAWTEAADASGCISACSSPRARAGEGSGRTERSPPHSQRRCYFNNTPLACMPGLILTLEPRQAGPNFPRRDLSQPFPFENKAPVPAPLSPQAAARCHGSCPTGQGKAGQDLPLGGLFGERGAQPPAAHSMGFFRKLAGSRGMLGCRAFPGILERLRFPQTSLGRRWVFFSTDIFIENAVGRFTFCLFFFFSLFPVNSHARERDFPSSLCVYLKIDW